MILTSSSQTADSQLASMAETHKPDPDPPGHQTNNAHIQPAKSMSTFPFEKLPAELQLMVIRFTMPQSGLRFQREDGRYHNATRGQRKRWYSWTRQEDSVPTALFLTNHHLSAIALDTLHRDVFMHIGVSNEVLSIFDQTLATHDFPGRVPADMMHYFTSMRSYRLNIRIGELHPRYMTNYILSRGMYQFLHLGLKARLELVSDMLAENPDVQRLTVTFPCCCTRPQAPNVPPIIPLTEDYLTILKGLKVGRSVQFVPAHGPDFQAEADLCNKPDCLDLARTFQASMGRLTGESRRHREEHRQREERRHREARRHREETSEGVKARKHPMSGFKQWLRKVE
ncbi:hypothetical protein XPA_000024 [Xanthoria parietina]